MNATRFHQPCRDIRFPLRTAISLRPPSVYPAVDLEPGVRPATFFPSATVILPRSNAEAITKHPPHPIPTFTLPLELSRCSPFGFCIGVASLDPCSLDFLRRSSYLAYKVSLTPLNHQRVSPKFSIFRHGKARLRLSPREMWYLFTKEVSTVLSLVRSTSITDYHRCPCSGLGRTDCSVEYFRVPGTMVTVGFSEVYVKS